MTAEPTPPHRHADAIASLDRARQDVEQALVEVQYVLNRPGIPLSATTLLWGKPRDLAGLLECLALVREYLEYEVP